MFWPRKKCCILDLEASGSVKSEHLVIFSPTKGLICFGMTVLNIFKQLWLFAKDRHHIRHPKT